MIRFLCIAVSVGFASHLCAQEANLETQSVPPVSVVHHDKDSHSQHGSSASTQTSIAGNAEVAEVIKTFEGRGVMRDDSAPTNARKALSEFKIRDGFEINLVASEPDLAQPLFLTWDSRGRLWVVEYRQYQFPAGLKVVRYDEHLRAVFDRVPQPPPSGPKGADRISVFEDTDGDGEYDKRKTVIDGLNIATSVAVDHDGIWVLNPPYLLYYPDTDHNDVPDGPPEVHLSGFGIQDTHSVANSLSLAPDGWLYGANGSTTVGNVSSAVTKGVRFEGQCIWRYHPKSKVFEIYAEGGGNTFSFEFDAGGRVFSGTNGGNTRGWYYPQGSFSHKNWGKHGPLTNPYAFGFFGPMKLEGDTRRFAQAFCIYEGGLFPSSFDQTIIAANSLHNLIWHSQLVADGSTYRTIDSSNLVDSNDRWFRPVYVGVGPDGAVYIADWYDTRLSHVSPLDDWHKESGRIYRVIPKKAQPKFTEGDLHLSSPNQLLKCFDSKNKWIRHRAAMELGWRNDQSVEQQLVQRVLNQHSLESLWVLIQMDRLPKDRANSFLKSRSADIRRWTIRALGDQHLDHHQLVVMAASEPDIHVRSQLASTAKRVSADSGLGIVKGLLSYDEDVNDPQMPLLIWWAIESHADSFDEVETMFSDHDVWQSEITQQFILERIMQRYALTSDETSLERCARLVLLAPDDASRHRLLEAFNLAFQGRPIPRLPETLHTAFAAYRERIGGSDLVFGIRQGNAKKITEALGLLGNPNSNIPLAIEVATAFGEIRNEKAEGLLLALATGRVNSSSALQRVALASLRIYDSPSIADQIFKNISSRISREHGLRDTAFRTLATRKTWASRLVAELDSQWRVRREHVPEDVVQQLRTYSTPEISRLVEKVFGSLSKNATDKQLAEMKRLRELVATRSGDASRGKNHFSKKCQACHSLFGEGGRIGPGLDGYERGKRTFWIDAIVVPGLEIREGFQSYLALTDDGRAITGMITEQTTDSVTIRTGEKQQTTLPRNTIEVLRAVPTSLMPANLLDDLSDQEICDLFAYLSLGT